MLITVTQEDIDVGRQRKCFVCPILQSLRRFCRSKLLPREPQFTGWCFNCTHSPTSYTTLSAFVDKNRLIAGCCVYKMPRSVSRFMKRFSKGKPVKPFNWFLKLESIIESDTTKG